jgi:hypothetical protein
MGHVPCDATRRDAPFVSRIRISRRWRYPSSSTISFTTASSLRISTSSRERDSWLAIALCADNGGCGQAGWSRGRW